MSADVPPRSPRRPLHTANWQRVAESIKRRDGYRCRQCGSTASLVVHHVVPVEDGGSEFPGPDGLVTLCARCHRRAHAANGDARRESPAERRDTRWDAFVDEL